MIKNAAAIGADIGRFSFDIAVVNSGGNVISRKSVPLEPVYTKDFLITRLLKAIMDMRLSVAALGVNPICVGFSVKGFIDHQAGIVIGPDHGINGWLNVPLARIVSRVTGLPTYVGNDANMMTIAEHRFGVARNYKNVVFIGLRTTGIGGGIIIDGKLYRGVNNAGGEIGQMIINYKDGLSDKGIRGSFEHFACAAALVRRYAEISRISYTKEKKRPTAKDIFELSYKNQKSAVKAVKENAEIVGIGLANLITIFAPEIVVIGGGMAEARDSYIEMIKESAVKNSLENCRTEVRIERAQLGSNASLLGSAYYSMMRLAGNGI